jgi:hypothetical protein
MNNTRKYERIPILGLLSGEIMVFEPMVVKAMSPGGITVETRFPLHLESLHDLRLTLSDQSVVVVKGRVVHSHIVDVDQEVVTYLGGLEFIELSDRARAAIVEFLEDIKARRAGL